MKTSIHTSRRSDRRDRLLRSAAAMFARWGYDKTSIEDIARDAAVSKGGVYLAFRSKEALFKAVIYRELGRYTQDWLSRFENDPGGWSFARMFQHSLAAIDANPFMKALVTRDQRIYGTFLQHDPDLIAMTVSLRTELFEQLQRAGAMRDDIPAPVLAYLVSSMGYGLIMGSEVFPERSKQPFEETLRATGLLLDRGLGPTQGHNEEAARKLIISMVDKIRAGLAAGGTGSKDE